MTLLSLTILFVVFTAPFSVNEARSTPISTNIHVVQVASFSSLSRTEKEMEYLRKHGFYPFVLDVYDSQHQLWYTISIGKHTDISTAQGEVVAFAKKTGREAVIFSEQPDTIALFEKRAFDRITKAEPQAESQRAELAEQVQNKSQLIHTVQVESFPSLDNALEEIEILRQQGFEPFMLNVYDDNHRLFHTIHIGRFFAFSEARYEAAEFSRKTGRQAWTFSKPAATIALFESRVVGKGPIQRDTPTFVAEKPEEHPEPIDQSEPAQEEANVTELLLSEQPLGEELVRQAEPIQAQVDSSQEQEKPVEVKQQPSTQEAQVEEPHPEEFPNKYYVLASFSVFHIHKDSDDLDLELATSGYTIISEIDQTNLGWNIVVGYNINKQFSVEAGYAQFHRVNTEINTSTVTTDLANETVKHAPLTMGGVVIEGVSSWDVYPRVSLISKAGAFLWTGEVKANYQGITATREETGVDVVLGAGLETHFLGRYALRFEYERFFTPDNVDLLSVGFKIGF